MFKKRKRKDAVRKKKPVDDDETGDSTSSTSASAVVRKAKPTTHLNTFSTSGRSSVTKRARQDGTEDTRGDATSLFAHESTRDAAAMTYSGGATAELQTETATDRDARAILEKNLALNESGAAGDGKYHGAAGRRNLLHRSQEDISKSKVTGAMGPIRAPLFVRSTARFDYQPDVCKDYKDTGFCGYGDNCKFAHDRGNYKTGWQMEKEFEEKQAKRKALLAAGLSVDEDEAEAEEKKDELPFACHICRQPFTNPIVTRCGHYFNQKCAIKRYSKTSACAICGEQTNGIFNVPSAQVAEKLLQGRPND